VQCSAVQCSAVQCSASGLDGVMAGSMASLQCGKSVASQWEEWKASSVQG
jgi:hypothetical protein